MVRRSEACAWLLVSGGCVCVREAGCIQVIQVVSVCGDVKHQNAVVHLIPFLPGSPVRVYHCLMTSHTTSVRNQHASVTQ